MPQNEPSEESIFALALEKPSPAERAAFVEGACVGNPSLFERVEGLLRSHEEAGSFLHQPLAPPTEMFGPDRLSEGPGTRIGPYKLLQQIGEGGMGVVYMAEQEHPVRRKIALKIIKPGMDSAQVVARFEAERQALAVMDHTNIAKVFDAGTTESGRPYFVMELVHGVPITDYCDANQLTPRERLELFVPVCQAIQHAHQKGIIHRDIKPSNVLVTMYDDHPVPKVIDFGVAKAVEQRLTERTLFTQYGALVGTFEYMSPEQAEMNAFGVDTRSDVFSLGVLLYELLTGTTPLEKQRLRQAALGELVRLIKEEEAPRPSVRLSGSGDLPKIAAARKTEPSRLSKLVRGEVDWIVMKCLEKDRTRRYETANALARDVERHLKDEPVEACPPSAGYLMRKFTRKYRMPMTIASCFAMLLLAGVVASTWQAARAKQAERAALAHADLATMSERKAVIAENTAKAKQIEAETARQSLRRSLYASDLQLAQTAWDSGNISRMRDLLDGQKPRADEVDLRGFEWHYLRRLGSVVRVSRLVPDAAPGYVRPDATHYLYAKSIDTANGPGAGTRVELKLIEIASGREVWSIDAFPGATASNYLFRPKFSPDSKRFVYEAPVRDRSGRLDVWIKTFECDTGRDVSTIANLSAYEQAAAFDHSGSRLVLITGPQLGDETSGLKIREVAGGKEVLTIPLSGRQIRRWHGAEFSPDGKHLAALTRPAGPNSPGGVGDLRVWDSVSGRELLRIEARPGSTGLAYSPDGRYLAEINNYGASHRLRDAISGKELLELTSAPVAGNAFGTAFSPDSSHLAISSGDGKVRIWDVSDKTGGSRDPESLMDAKTGIWNEVVWSADGRQVLTVSGSGNTVMTWQMPARAPQGVVKGLESTTEITATVATARSRFAAAFEEPDRQNVLKVWDEAGNILFTATDPPVVGFGASLSMGKVNLSRDGTRLAYSDYNPFGPTEAKPARWRVWEIASGREIFRQEEEKGPIDHIAISPDGRRLATERRVIMSSLGERKTIVSSWDLDTGQERLHLELPDFALLAFSPDGRRLAIGITAGVARQGPAKIMVLDASSGKSLLTRPFDVRLIGDLAYNGGGTSLAVAIGNAREAGVIKVLDAETGRERLSLAGHRNMIRKLAFSPDGRRLASLASVPMQGSEIKLWDLAGGREMLTLQTTRIEDERLRTNADCAFGFSPDGRRLFYIPGGRGRDAELQVWDATPLPDDQAAPLALP